MTKLVNPSQEEAMRQPVGTTFVIEGVLRQAEQVTIEEPTYPGSPRTLPEHVTNVVIETENGTWTLVSRMGRFLYKGGVLENLRDAEAHVGETIAIQAAVTLSEGRQKIVLGYAQPELLVPSSERMRDYEGARFVVRELASSLDKAIREGNFGHARHVFAGIREGSPTSAEQKLIRRMIRRMPLSERPVFDPSSTYCRDALKRAFSVNIEEFNAEAFLNFSHQVLCGEIENAPKPDRVDQSYLYRFLHLPMFTTEQAAKLVESAIKARIARLESITDDHDEYWDDYWIVETSVEWAARFTHPTCTSALAWLIDYCLQKGYIDNRLDAAEEHTCPRRFDFIDKAVHSMINLIQEQPERGPAFEAFDTGRLLQWRDTLSGYPFMTPTADKIRSIIEG